jgi:RNA polymerase sigma-70 factor (ECF subfamily)
MPVDAESAYRRHGPMVRRRCQRLLRDPEQARDAMHDTFVRLVRRRDDLDERALGSLLFRIATNVCLNRLRTRHRRPEDPDDELVARIAAADDPAERGAARSLLDRLFAREPESTRTIAVLHLLDGMTLEEVAAEVGLSVSGVRFRLRGLRAQLPELEEAR